MAGDPGVNAEPRGPLAALLGVVRVLAYATPFVALICGGEIGIPDVLYPNVVWKHVAFRALVEAMTGLWIVLLVFDPRYRPRFTWILGVYAAFVAVLAVANALGVRPAYSFWGNFERMEGLWGHLHLFAFFLVTAHVFDRDAWHRFFRVCLVVCLVVCAFAAVQFVLGLLKAAGVYDGRPFHQDVPVDAMGRSYLRVDARIASPVFLGVYSMMHVFLAAILARRARSTVTRWCYVALAVLSVVVLALTGSRGAQLGLALGGLLSLGLIGLRGSDGVRPLAGKAFLVLVGLIAVAGVLTWLKPPFLGQIPIAKRLFALELSGAFGARLYLWDMVWQGFLERPLFGWGQENFAYVYNKFFHPALFSRELPQWWDHPHNAFLGWLVAGGLPAFGLYLGLFGSGAWYLWRRCGLSLAERSLWSAMLLGYALFNCVQLDNLTSYLLFFAFLGYLHALARPGASAAHCAEPPTVNGARVAVAAIVAIGVVAAVFWSTTVPSVQSGLYLARGVRASVLPGPDGRPPRNAEVALANFRRALDTGGMGRSEVRDQIARHVNYSTASARVSPELKNQFVEFAFAEMRAEVEQNPDNAHDRYFYGGLLFDIAQQARRAEYAQEALTQIEKALEISPQRQLFMFELANIQLRLGNKEAAIEMLRRAREVYPESKEARVLATIGVIRAGDRALETRWLDEMRRSVKTRTFRVDQRIVEALEEQERWNDVIALLEPIVNEWRGRVEKGEPVWDAVRQRIRSLVDAYLQVRRPRRAIELLEWTVEHDEERRAFWQEKLDELRRMQPR